MIERIWDFIKVNFKAKIYVFSIVVVTATLFKFFPSPIVQLPSLLICLVFILLMAIFLVIDTVGNLKNLILMAFKAKTEIQVPDEVLNLATKMGVKCNSFKIVADDFNACVLPTGTVLIGDKTFYELTMDELLAVFAHEFSHNRRKHYVLKISAFAFLFITGYLLFHDLPDFMLWYAMFAFTSIALIPFSYYIELEADKDGKSFVGAAQMISALEKISKGRNPNEGSETHPPIAKRVQELKKSDTSVK